MNIRLHKNATTTPRTRAYIQQSDKSNAELARELSVELRRSLRRHGVGKLAELMPEGPPKSPSKPFKDYVPGFVHIDIKYLPQMLDESQRRYLFVAIDRATRGV